MRLPRTFTATILLVILSVVFTPSIYITESSSEGFEATAQVYLSKSSNNTILGSLELSKTANVSDGLVKSRILLYAKLHDGRGEVNFTSRLDCNLTLEVRGNTTRWSSSFKLIYVDYSVLPRLVGVRQVSIDSSGVLDAIVTGGRLNSTLKTLIKPSTGNAMRDRALVAIIADILNETMRSVKEELEKRYPNTTLKYKVTISQDGYAVLLEVNLTTSLKIKMYEGIMSERKGYLKLKALTTLKQNQTIIQAMVEVSGFKGLRLNDVLKTLYPGFNTTKLEVTLDNMNKLLESANTILSSISNTVTQVTTITPQVREGSEQTPTITEATKPQVTQTQTGTEGLEVSRRQEGRGMITLLIVAMASLIALVLIATYMLLMRRS